MHVRQMNQDRDSNSHHRDPYCLEYPGLDIDDQVIVIAFLFHFIIDDGLCGLQSFMYTTINTMLS